MGTRQAVKHCSRLYVQLSIPVAENRALLMVSSQQLLVGSRSYAARVPHKAPFEDDRAASIFSQLSICNRVNRVNRVLSVLKVTKGDFWTLTVSSWQVQRVAMWRYDHWDSGRRPSSHGVFSSWRWDRSLRLDCLTFHSKAMAPDSGLFHIQQRLCWSRGSTSIATLYSIGALLCILQLVEWDGM